MIHFNKYTQVHGRNEISGISFIFWFIYNRKCQLYHRKGFPRTPHIYTTAIWSYMWLLFPCVVFCGRVFVCFAPRSHAVGDSVFGPEV